MAYSDTVGALDDIKEASEAPKEKVTRDAFLYMEPKSNEPDFGQCKTCIMWTGEKTQTCTIHGNKHVGGDDSCGLYVPGKPHAAPETKRVTPEESGLVDREVRCENCVSFSGGKCGLFAMLNKKSPETFDLKEKVSPQGCCNAQRPA